MDPTLHKIIVRPRFHMLLVLRNDRFYTHRLWTDEGQTDRDRERERVNHKGLHQGLRERKEDKETLILTYDQREREREKKIQKHSY